MKPMLFTPGPIPMDPETIASGGTQAPYFRTPEFSKTMLDCMDMLIHALDAPLDAGMIFLTASGTAAMEATVINLFTPKDKLLIIAGGTFGKRFKKICEIHEIPAEVISLEWNEAFSVESLLPYEKAGITGMLVNMCETSTGQLYPMDVISSFCKRNGICLVVDAISSFMCDPLSMKNLNADAVIISSQKGLGLNPGMSFIAVSKKAFDERCGVHPPKSLYFRFVDYYPEILRGQTEYTPAIGIVTQLHEKLLRIMETSPQYHVDYCFRLAQYFRKSILEIPSFRIPTYTLSNCVTPVLCDGGQASRLVSVLRDQYNVYVVPAAGALAEKMFRVAHMSTQIKISDIDHLIGILRKEL